MGQQGSPARVRGWEGGGEGEVISEGMGEG